MTNKPTTEGYVKCDKECYIVYKHCVGICLEHYLIYIGSFNKVALFAKSRGLVVMAEDSKSRYHGFKS